MVRDQGNTAVIFIDYQEAMCSQGELSRLPALAAEIARRDAITKARALLDAARDSEAYVVHVRLAFDGTYELRTNRTARWDAYPENRAMLVGSPEAQIIAEMAPLAGEPVVIKGAVDPFIGTSLASMLIGNRVGHVILAGVATNLAVESAARHAADSGFAVSIAEDACASFSEAAHDFAVSTMLPMFSTVTSTDELISQLPR